MRVIVDQGVCDKHSICIAKCPEVFEMDTRGKVSIKMDRIDTKYKNDCRDAAEACPVKAITIIE